MTSILSAEMKHKWDRAQPFRAIVDADLLIRAGHCVSNEEIRYYLQGVHVEPHADGGARLVATDGHKLILIRDPNAFIKNGTGIVRLAGWLRKKTREYIKIDRKAKLRKRKSLKIVINGPRAALMRFARDTLTEASITDAFHALRSPDSSVLAMQDDGAIVDGKFPDVSKVLDVVAKKATADAIIEPFNPRVLSSVEKALRSYRGASLHLTGAGKGEPILVRAGSEDIDGFGVIMPMRADRLTQMPGWSNLPKAAAEPKTQEVEQ